MVSEAMKEIFKNATEEAYGAVDECRDYDAVLAGIRAVLKSKGTNKTIMEIANMWHCPLAMCHKADFDLDKIVKNMEWATGFVDYSGKVKVWETRYDGYMSGAPMFVDEDMVKRLASGLLETEIRRQFSGLRKNSKKWKELEAKNMEKAVKVIKRNEGSRYVDEGRRWMKNAENHVEECRDKVKKALWNVMKCQDIELIAGGMTDKTKSVREDVKQYVDAAMAHIKWVEAEMLECAENMTMVENAA